MPRQKSAVVVYLTVARALHFCNKDRSNNNTKPPYRSLLFWIAERSVCTFALQVPNFACKVCEGGRGDVGKTQFLR